MTFTLITADAQHKDAILEALSEWKAYNQLHPEANASPATIFSHKTDDFASYVRSLTELEPTNPDWVAHSTYFLFDSSENKVLGAINFRHKLNNYLYMYGGHIGYGILPSQRKRGYGIKLLELGLKKCKDIGLREILLCCDVRNLASQNLIRACGGVLENEVIAPNGLTIQRYWIYT